MNPYLAFLDGLCELLNGEKVAFVFGTSSGYIFQHIAWVHSHTSFANLLYIDFNIDFLNCNLRYNLEDELS